MDYSYLIQLAFEAREKSIAGYSGFAVGAALLCADGSVFTGCNIECSAFPASICAERTAVFKALSEGIKDFKALAIVGGKADEDEPIYCPPCGSCRQVIAEFCRSGDFEVVLARSVDDYVIYTVDQLLPDAFTGELL